jgi:hypothetical protein
MIMAGNLCDKPSAYHLPTFQAVGRPIPALYLARHRALANLCSTMGSGYPFLRAIWAAWPPASYGLWISTIGISQPQNI